MVVCTQYWMARTFVRVCNFRWKCPTTPTHICQVNIIHSPWRRIHAHVSHCSTMTRCVWPTAFGCAHFGEHHTKHFYAPRNEHHHHYHHQQQHRVVIWSSSGARSRQAEVKAERALDYWLHNGCRASRTFTKRYVQPTLCNDLVEPDASFGARFEFIYSIVGTLRNPNSQS